MATKRERDWKELAKDLVGLIAERLSVVDFIHLSTVCTSWASAVDGGGTHGLYRPQGAQSPWLLLPSDESEYSDTCTFFSIVDNKSYTITSLPELSGNLVVGSTEGWLVTVDKASQARLLNPFTRAQLLLPSATTFPNVQVVRNSEGDITEFLLPLPDVPPIRWSSKEFQYNYILKAALSSSPTPTITSTNATHEHNGNGYIVMAIFWASNKLAFAKAGDDKWTVLESEHDIQDVIYHKGKFYSITWHSQLQAWDLSRSSPKMMMTILEPIEDNHDCEFTKYLVESSEELLLVCRRHAAVNGFLGSKKASYTTTEVKIFKLDPRGAKWIRVSSLGDRCLFFGLSHSMSLSARDIPGLMRNCIYFTDDHWNSLHRYHELNCDMKVFNLEDGSFTPYYPHDSLKNLSAPIWFMPNLLL